MIVLLPSRGLAAAALAAGLLLAGCSSDSDVPPTEVSAPGGGTQMNTDTGSGGTFPDVNTVPYQRPTSTIQDLVQAPDGLGAAQAGTQYSDALIGGPTSSAAPPPPPPPPEPPQEALAPIPEPGIQTDTSDAPEPVRTPSEPVAAPEVVEPEVVEPEPVEQSVTAAPEPVPESAGQGQTIQGTIAEPAPSDVPQPEPAAPEVAEAIPAEPVPAAPAPMTAAPQEPAAPMAPRPDAAAAAQQAQLPPSAYEFDPQAADPTAYGISVPGAAPSPSQPEAAASPAARSAYGGEPVGMIYFREGSSSLSADDLQVLQQIAGMQRTHGGIINVVGHASVAAEGAGQTGLQDATQQISEARAVAVAQGLMQYGVPQSAIRTSGAGALEPLQSEAANRRADVYLTGY